MLYDFMLTFEASGSLGEAIVGLGLDKSDGGGGGLFGLLGNRCGCRVNPAHRKIHQRLVGNLEASVDVLFALESLGF